MRKRLLSSYIGFLNWFIPAKIRSNPAELSRSQNVVNATMCAALTGPLFACVYWILGDWRLAAEVLCCCLAMFCAPFILKASGNRRLAQEVFILAVYFNFAWLTYHLGGVSSPVTPWLMICPVVAMLLGGIASSAIWLAVSVITILANYALEVMGWGFPPIGLTNMPLLRALCDIGLVFVIVLFVLLFELTKTEGFRRLESALQTIRELAIRDELTGAYNRRHVLSLAEEERERALRSGSVFCVCVLDVDFFKRVNDRFGHGGGDAVLKAFALATQASLRSTDTIGRYGGEEFLAILPYVSAQDCKGLAERLREGVQAMRFPEISDELRVSVSIGIAQFERDETVSQTIARADEALYWAKQNGRNQVARYGIEFAPRPAPAPGRVAPPAP